MADVRQQADARVGAPREAPLHGPVLIVGGSRHDRVERLEALVRTWQASTSTARVWRDDRPDTWPFRPDLFDALTPGTVVVARDVPQAFPDRQINGTRLVLTQSIYQLQSWLDALDAAGGCALLMEGAAAAMRARAPEAFAGRGAWAGCRIIDLGPDVDEADAGAPREAPLPDGGVADAPPDAPWADDAGLLGRAFGTMSPDERFDVCQRLAMARPDSAVVQLAAASACMERTALDEAARALERASRLAPAWGAVAYEQGKLHLRNDDMERAADAFARASRALPRFGPAFSNLGAALGEIDRPEEALDAFRHALALDPANLEALNNVGVTLRELGRLDESADAFRRVTAMSPDFVFGHYNLGHTLFLQGRFDEAAAAYEAGQRQDPQRNAVQASRLALALLAAGDPDRARREMSRALDDVTPERRGQLVDDCREILAALRAWRADLPGGAEMADLLGDAPAG